MKQDNIFGDTVETLPTLTLHTPPQEEWQYIQDMLESRCNKQELLTYAEAFLPWLNTYGRIMRTTDDGQTTNATECAVMMKTSTAKWEIARGIALIVADKQNMQQYIDSMKTGMKALWRMVLANVYVSVDSAKQVLNVKHDLFKMQRGYYYYSDNFKWNSREYGWFAATDCFSSKTDKWGYREKEKYITVSSLVRKLFFPYFFPEAEESDISLAELPDGEWRTFNLETDSVGNFNLFSALYKQGELPMKKKGIGIADIKRALKKMALTEFFPDSDNEYHQNMRGRYYLQLLAMNETFRPTDKRKRKTPVPTTCEDTMRELITNIHSMDLYMPALLYPHIKGLRKQMTDYSREPHLADMMLNMLREEPERWIGLNDMMLKCAATESDGGSSRYNTLVFHPNDEQYSAMITNEYSQQPITAERFTQEYGYTALQAFALIFCSLGLVEVTLNEGEQRHLSPFDAVDYMRLTPLGRYALGITSEYEAPEQEHTAYFELDPDRLIIRSLVSPNPYAQLLLDTSTPISRNRFETSAQSFLANCHQREDVEMKISIFRRFIASELPPLWEEFFQQLLLHCHPLTEDKTSYKHYTLQPINRDLIQLVTTDPVLRQIVVRAEGYRIMVSNADIKKFEQQLKKHGYLL